MGEHVLAQLVQRESRVDRRAVAEQMQGRVREVDDTLSARPGDPRLPDRPLAGHGPVEDPGPRRGLDDLEWHVPPKRRERGANTVPGQAARQRKQLAHQLHELFADGAAVRHGIPVDRHQQAGGRADVTILAATNEREPSVSECLPLEREIGEGPIPRGGQPAPATGRTRPRRRARTRLRGDCRLGSAWSLRSSSPARCSRAANGAGSGL